jgi:ubiquinone/menaquinone biosynthesis C-methylase UbiE
MSRSLPTQSVRTRSFTTQLAAGPGVGAAALVAALPKNQLPKKMLVSDNVAMMVNAALESLAGSPLPDVDCKELDSQDLKSVPDNYFTYSIDNFSIFTFIRPSDAIRETYRTLCPDGFAIVTCWRRFAPMFIVRAAQKKIRLDFSDSGGMSTPSPEFYEEGVLQRVVQESGFTRTNITMIDKVLVVTEEDNIAGLTMLMSGPLMAKALEIFTEEEPAKWSEAVSQSVEEEVAKIGGIKFEAYVLWELSRGANVFTSVAIINGNDQVGGVTRFRLTQGLKGGFHFGIVIM